MTVKFHGYEGLIDTLNLIIAYAKQGKLVSAKFKYEPTGFGDYAYKLLDDDPAGTPAFDMSDVEQPETPPTAPGKRQPKP